MARIVRDERNIVEIPKGVSVTQKGYVYYNQSTVWVNIKNGPGKTADHKKECVGIALNPGSDWMSDRRMYANPRYYELFTQPSSDCKKGGSDVYPEYPDWSNCISVGLHAVVEKVVTESELSDVLAEVFGSENSRLILDLASYMLSTESAVFQHFPHWARSQVLFSEVIRSDSYISDFETSKISVSEINLFKKKWFRIVIKDGRVYLVYDSTNVNSQAKGVCIVELGHAKDDPSLEQVNTEYVIRQKDGMPVTYKCYPGSINDISEASEMIAFFKELLEEDKDSKESKEEPDVINDLVMIADRGYTSEDNIRGFRSNDMGFLLLLKQRMKIHIRILDKYIDEVKRPENYIPESRKFALTVKEKLFVDDEEDSFFHIVWDAALEASHRAELYKEIDANNKKLQKAVERHTLLTQDELDSYKPFFDINYHANGTFEVNQRGRGAGKKKTVPAFVVESFAKNNDEINKEDKRCGYIIYVSNEIETALEALLAMSKRDIVEKVFRALKSWLGMEKLGVHSEDAMQSKSLIWFVASIIHSLIFTKTEKLRVTNKKDYTMPAIIDILEEVTVDKDLETGVYKRRYGLRSKQKKVLKCFNIDTAKIDAICESICHE